MDSLLRYEGTEPTRHSLPPAPTVGRDGTLALLVDRLERAIAGEGRVLLLGGDAGVGKSRVVREVKHAAAEREIRVIEGRCSSTESSVPYAPLMDALRFRISRGESAAVGEVLGPLRTVLAPLFPQLGQESTGETPGERERPFDLIFRVLERLASNEPTLLILEDVHWADQTSLELLHHLAHRAPSLGLLIIATYRSDELHSTHPLRKVLGSMARDRIGEEVRLLPLTREDTAEMLQRMLGMVPDSSFAAAIWKRAEGNPFFVEEIIGLLHESGSVDLRSETAAAALDRLPLPSTVSEAVLSRLNSLNERATETISAAAVIGRTVEFEDLRGVLGMSELELLEVIEQLIAHQLLREEKSEGPDCYAFPHALMQEAIYASIISRRRRMLHRRVAAVLEQRSRRQSTRLDELAYHYRLGGDRERAFEYARRAGDEAVRLRAWDDAAEHYEHALASLEELSDQELRTAELLERLAGVAWRQSRRAAGQQYAEDALRLRRALGQSEDSARLLRRLAALRIEEGDTEGAGEALDEALRLIGKSGSDQLSAIYDDLGRLSLERGELDRAETLLTQGLSLASRDSNGAEEVLALVSLGQLSILGGRVSDGVARLDLSLALLREGRRLPFERLTRVYADGVRTLLLAQEYSRSLDWAESARDLCQRQGVVGMDAHFRSMRAAVLTITSGEEDTLKEAAEAVSELRRTGRAELRDALRVLAFIHRARGDLDQARSAYEEAISHGERGRPVGLALVALAQGRNHEAVEILEPALHAVPPTQPLMARQLLPYAVEALIAVGRIDAARKLVDETPVIPDARAGSAQLLHAKGLVLLAEGLAAEATEAFRASAESWEEIGNRLESRRVRVALLEAMLSAGNTTESLALGRALLEELGRPLLPRERDTVRRLLRRAGVRTKPDRANQRDRSAGGAGLTIREEAVLGEVARGRTNKEIAAALGIAEKTVSVHVSHILAKLGCRTRTQAARFVRIEGSPGEGAMVPPPHEHRSTAD